MQNEKPRKPILEAIARNVVSASLADEDGNEERVRRELQCLVINAESLLHVDNVSQSSSDRSGVRWLYPLLVGVLVGVLGAVCVSHVRHLERPGRMIDNGIEHQKHEQRLRDADRRHRPEAELAH